MQQFDGSRRFIPEKKKVEGGSGDRYGTNRNFWNSCGSGSRGSWGSGSKGRQLSTGSADGSWRREEGRASGEKMEEVRRGR